MAAKGGKMSGLTGKTVSAGRKVSMPSSSTVTGASTYGTTNSPSASGKQNETSPSPGTTKGVTPPKKSGIGSPQKGQSGLRVGPMQGKGTMPWKKSK